MGDSVAANVAAPSAEGRQKFGFQLGGLGASSRKKGAVVPPPSGRHFEVDDRTEETDYVTAIAGSTVTSSRPKEVQVVKVIPLLAVNQWRTSETTDGAGPAVLCDTPSTTDPTPSITEPATLEERAVAALKQDAVTLAEGVVDEESTKVVPLLMQNRVPGYDDAKDDKERYLIDVSLRPDETSLDAYDEMPISDFGKAALLGMGWKDGEAIGGTNKGLAEPIVGVPRLRGLGLGATRDTELQPGHRKIKKYVKPGELRNPNQKQMQVAPGADGKVRHTRGLDEKLVEKEIPTMKENAFVLVGSGPHSGVCAKVKKIWSDRIEVELASGSRISTREEDVRLLTNAEYKALKKQQPKRTADEANGGGSSTNGSRKKRREEPSWLEQNIRVRVISDRYRGGKFYNKKVRVVDVTKPTECNCVDEDQSGLLLEGLRQSELETVIPKKVGGTVMIVLGRCKGSRGKLLEKDKRKSTVVVQLMGESEVDSFRYDQVSEYIGEDMDGDW